ncbi:FAD:protein FMN transferase [Thermotalea metallivorans]|uniref:FAD:protein FMN transferase n=1 Tax=Thermotalea metallivorans TaxID=520762 RepID=A0A140L929_9FIRM|nr:FAD:protein FMN transferase [Thermotalea metallivorans]KXG77054.1 FAD:protein FMN transferase [Thermotalea metallivorans]
MKKKTFLLAAQAFVIIFVFLLPACNPQKQMITDSAYMLGTHLQLSLWTEDKAEGMAVIRECFQRIYQIEQKMSVNIANSEVNEINRYAGKEYVAVSDDTMTVLRKGFAYAALTDGAFNPAIGPLVKLWGIGTEKERVPRLDEIQEVLKYVDYKGIKFQDENKVKLDIDGMQLDLGGIAKGYAADAVTKIIREKGIKHAIINLGGNVVAVGKKTDGTPWKIGIQDPFEPTGTHMGVIEITDQTVVTSGNYERYFMRDGKRYHHIIDPKTGYPSENGVISATIITDSSIDADALSTSVYVLGLEKGMKLIESMEGVECIIITEGKKVYLSSGLKGRLKIANDGFEIVD